VEEQLASDQVVILIDQDCIYVFVGALSTQVGTAHAVGGPRLCSDVPGEQLMRAKGFEMSHLLREEKGGKPKVINILEEVARQYREPQDAAGFSRGRWGRVFTSGMECTGAGHDSDLEAQHCVAFWQCFRR
jgi:hypothetical protein